MIRFFWLALFAFPLSVIATTSPSPAAAAPQPISGIFQVLFALLVVLALIGGCAWLLKKMTPGGLPSGAGLRVVGGVMVGPKERVVVVEMGDTWLVLGVTAAQVNTLHTLPKPEGAAGSAGTNAIPPFAKWLQTALKKRDAGNVDLPG